MSLNLRDLTYQLRDLHNAIETGMSETRNATLKDYWNDAQLMLEDIMRDVDLARIESNIIPFDVPSVDSTRYDLSALGRDVLNGR